MSNAAMLKAAASGLQNYYSNADDIVKSVVNHAALAAGSAALSGCLPGAGAAAAAAVSIGIIVKMYFSLGKLLGVHLGNGVLKAMASAVVADLAGSVAAVLAVATALTFIPGIGTIGAAGITGMTSFCYVYLAGMLFIKMVGSLLRNGKSIESMSEAELVQAVRKESGSIDMKQATKEAISSFRKSGK